MHIAIIRNANFLYSLERPLSSTLSVFIMREEFCSDMFHVDLPFHLFRDTWTTVFPNYYCVLLIEGAFICDILLSSRASLSSAVAPPTFCCCCRHSSQWMRRFQRQSSVANDVISAAYFKQQTITASSTPHLGHISSLCFQYYSVHSATGLKK